MQLIHSFFFILTTHQLREIQHNIQFNHNQFLRNSWFNEDRLMIHLHVFSHTTTTNRGTTCQAHNGSAHNGSARDVPWRDVPWRPRTTPSQTSGHMSQISGHMSQTSGHMSQISGHMSQISGHMSQTSGHHRTQHSYIHSLIATHMQTHSFLFFILTTHQLREIQHNIQFNHNQLLRNS